MAKLQSSLKNMLLSLTLIALVAAGLLAGVYALTAGTIEETNKKNIAAAKLEVLPAMEGLEVAEEGEQVENSIIYPATVNGEVIGAAVETLGSGFGGEFKLMVGIVGDTISGYKVLSHQETPGLGAKMGEWFKGEGTQKVAGRNPMNLDVVKKGGAPADGKEQLDAITAATISSRAFLAAIQQAYSAFKGTDAQTGATALLNVATVLTSDSTAANDSIVEPVNVGE